MLYQVAIMQRPRKKKDKEKLLFMTDWFIADGPEQAGMKAVIENRDAPSLIDCDFDHMEILVRPFS